jgi:hypothetical protein
MLCGGGRDNGECLYRARAAGAILVPCPLHTGYLVPRQGYTSSVLRLSATDGLSRSPARRARALRNKPPTKVHFLKHKHKHKHKRKHKHKHKHKHKAQAQAQAQRTRHNAHGTTHTAYGRHTAPRKLGPQGAKPYGACPPGPCLRVRHDGG